MVTENGIWLSIIVAVYNTEIYLADCIDSLLKQQLSGCEIILVDDGSTDNSGGICDGYAEKCKDLIRVIHQENQGHTAARENGFLQSSGRYILLMDSDDWLQKGALESLAQTVRKYEPDIISYGYRAVKDGKVQVEPDRYAEGIYDKDALRMKIYPTMIYYGKFYQFGIAPNMWNKIFRRELVEQFLMTVPREIRQ